MGSPILNRRTTECIILYKNSVCIVLPFCLYPQIFLLLDQNVNLQTYDLWIFDAQAEGIFRINAENSQEEYVREQLNVGVVPDDVDVHCLAGLIKVVFRKKNSFR